MGINENLYLPHCNISNLIFKNISQLYLHSHTLQSDFNVSFFLQANASAQCFPT